MTQNGRESRNPKGVLTGFMNDVIEAGLSDDEIMRDVCLNVVDEMLRLGFVDALDVYELFGADERIVIRPSGSKPPSGRT